MIDMISKILHNIYIGDIHDMTNVQTLKEMRIGAILNCAIEHHKTVFNIIKTEDTIKFYWQLPLHDADWIEGEWILSGIQYINLALKLRKKVLVACAAGMSRSVGIVLAYMMSEGWEYNEAFLHIRKKRPCMSPHRLVLLSVRRYFK